MRKPLLLITFGLLGLATLLGALTATGSSPVGAALPPISRTPPGGPALPAVPAWPGFSVLDAGNPNVGYGFTMALLGNNQRAANMGFRYVMYTLGWDTANPSPGVYSWGDADNIANAAQAANVHVLLRVMYTPSWARPGGTINSYPPTDANTFGTFMGALAAHLQSYHRFDYEIWNEPNVSDNWGGLFPDPAGYVALLRAAYPQIKTSDASARVLGPAVTTVGDLPPSAPHSAMGDLAYLNGIYDAGGAPYFDILSDHPYGFGDVPELDPRTSNHPLVFRRAELHRELMVQRGDGAKQIWATEMGWAIDPALAGHPECGRPAWYFIFSPQQQADYLVRAYQWARSRWSWMGAMFIFNYDFNQAPWYTHPCFAFDWFSVYGNPAESALANQALHPPPTYTPLPSPSPTPVDGPPVIESTSFSQLMFNRAGGTVSLDVTARDQDATAIDTVQTTMRYPNGNTQLFTLALASGTNQHGTWHLDQALGPNTTGADEPYQFTIDVIEQFPTRRVTSTGPYTVTVTPWRFWDVPSSLWAYPFVEWMATEGAISGYADGSFRPNNTTTRGQLTKMIVLAEHWTITTPATPTFEDVPATHPFFAFIETAYAHTIISGYTCGGPGEPCDPAQRPYFRPGADVTRGQLSKMISSAEGWPPQTPATPTFADVPSTHPFFGFVEAVAAHGIVSGYACGGPGEPCDPQQRPYFRPGNSATRAQLSKMIYLAITGRATATPTTTPAGTQTPTTTPTPATTATRTPTAPPTIPNGTGTPTPTRTLTPTGTPPTATATRTPTVFVSPTVTRTPTITVTPGLIKPDPAQP